MSKKSRGHHAHFYGTVTIGEKGQVVIPKEARDGLKLNKGDRLLVFGPHDDMLAIVKLSQVEKITSHLSKSLKRINDMKSHE